MKTVGQNKQGLKVLLAGAVLQLFLGIIYVWSVFVAPVSHAYEWAPEAAKLTASYMLSFFVLGILAGGKLQQTIGTPKVVLAGGLMLAAGMLATAFVPAGTPWMIYITYGIVGGFGVGMGYNAIISSAQKWFPQNRGFATGVSVFSFGLSTVLFAPLVEALVKAFDVRTTFMILAGTFFVAVLALFSFIKTPDSAAAALSYGEQKQYTTQEILRTKRFYYITVSMMLATATYFILNPSLKSMAPEKGLPDTIGTVLVMITGVANAFGRLGVPLLSDKIGREKAALTIISITALCAAALGFVSGGAFLAVVAVIAFCYGGFSGIYPVITSENFGVKNVGSNYGAVMVGFAFSALVFPMILGRIASPQVKFFTLAAMAVLGAVLMVLLILTNKKQEKAK